MAFLSTAIAPVAQFLISCVFVLVAFNLRFPQRLSLAPFITFFLVNSFFNVRNVPSWIALDSLWGLFIIIFFLHNVSVLYVERWYVNTVTVGDQNHPIWGYKVEASDEWQLKAALKAFIDPRQNARLFSEPAKQKSRTSFAISTILKVCILVCVRYIWTTFIFPGYLSTDIYFFDPYHEHYFSRLLGISRINAPITLDETLVRAFFAWDFAIQAYVQLQGCHYVLALFFVCVARMDTPHEWPELFGSILQITSIKSFWSKFWHRVVIQPYISFVLILTRKILRQTPDSKFEKFLVALCIFLLSGLVHTLVSWNMGYCGIWKDTWFFLVNFVAVTFEMVLQGACRKVSKKFGLGQEYRRFVNGRVARLLGFMWVWCFFFCAVPRWHYPKVYCGLLKQLYSM